MQELQQYLVGGDPGDLQAVLDQLQADPSTDVLNVVRDATGAPERLVVALADDRAAALSSSFPQLIVEPDAPLQPSGPDDSSNGEQQ